MPSSVTDRPGGLSGSIVVGVDGSTDAWAALVWAASLCGDNGTLHAVQTISSAASAVAPATSDPDHIEQLLAQFEAEVAGALDGMSTHCQVTCHLFEGGIVDGLIEIATVTEAALVVVGAHGHSKRRPKMVGGVVHRLLHDAELPVAVVRAHGDLKPKAPSSFIVGVGDGPATVAAVNWAASMAVARGLPVRLVHGATPEHRTVFNLERAMRKALEKVALLVDPEELLRWVNEDLDALAEELHEQPEFANVAIATTAKLGPAGPVLVAEAERTLHDQPVIVMGKHFDGAVTGYFTTAALHHVLTHAPCPIVIVPQHLDPD